ncbi:MAG: carboxylesterase family protein [Vicinamibacterales bacterium]|nr:carboxylesterase family protein [Vicinamibacterales bacterium]MDP7478114.1 carboxylesterase family protein [Vicinamibacterales bacterium]MDP7691122.1 carboxylesterase family protein [Vicinamibacterales bacterium]HJN44085.1 carboxylesterase family protein [Vicinamibacterales bacterium]
MTRATTTLLAGLALAAVGCGGAGETDEAGAPVTDPLTIAVTGGDIAGAMSDIDATVRVFKGIPFAAPPEGELRWQSPQPVAAWEDSRDATAFAPACMQATRPVDSFYGPGADEMSEDCLYLNVWTAAESADAAQPVLVWVHGGGLNNGTGASVVYRGEALAARGAVVVTTNYRLGPLGYLAHALLSAEDPHGSSGNYGVLDQVAALEWVRDNIAAFGGDPNRVTIFGESAGSWSVNVLQATPLAAGLFHGVIGESGGVFGGTSHLTEASMRGDSAEAVGERWIDGLLAASGGEVSLASMRAVTGEQIVEFTRSRAVGFRTAANVDGWVLEQSVYDTFASGKQHDVPIIVGSNADEGTTLAAGGAPADLAAHRTAVERQFGAMAATHHDVYPASTDEEARRAYFDSYASRSFGWEMRTWADLMSRVGSPAYLYYFTRSAPAADRDQLRAFHAAEIVYVFNNLGRAPYPYANRDYDDRDRELSNELADTWVRFAATGNPNGGGLPEWPAYSPDGHPTMVFGDTTEAGPHPAATQLDFVDEFQAGRRHEFSEN